MKKLIVAATMVLLSAHLGCAQNANLVLDDFEGSITGGAEGTVDFGAGNGSSVVVTAATDIKNSGTQSLKVEYNAIAGGYMYIARGSGLDAKNALWLALPDSIDWKKYNAISFYLYGADSKTRVAFDIKDNGGEIWRFITEDNFRGWKKTTCAFSDFFARGDWQPDNAEKNATLDFPLKSYQFEPLPESKGTLYFDTVELTTK